MYSACGQHHAGDPVQTSYALAGHSAICLADAPWRLCGVASPPHDERDRAADCDCRICADFAADPQADWSYGGRFARLVYLGAGFVTGIGNVLVGVIAPVLGAILRFENLTKERMVGTLGFFGFAGNVFKVAGFSLVGFAVADFLVTIICASLATIGGNVIGKRVLAGVSNQMFARAFQVMLALLAISLIWDAMIAG